MSNSPVLATPAWIDKRLWVSILTPIFILIAKKWGVQLDATEITTLVLPIVTYVVMSNWKSKGLTQAAIEAGATAAAKPATPGVVPPAQQ